MRQSITVFTKEDLSSAVAQITREVLARARFAVHYANTQQMKNVCLNDKEGRMEGKFEGKIEEQLLIAKNLLKKNMSVDFIAEATGLSTRT